MPKIIIKIYSSILPPDYEDDTEYTSIESFVRLDNGNEITIGTPESVGEECNEDEFDILLDDKYKELQPYADELGIEIECDGTVDKYSERFG